MWTLARVRALWPPTPYQAQQEHGPVVALFKLMDPFQVQEGERPKLRGQDATQLIVFKVSAIRGLEWKADSRASKRAIPKRRRPPRPVAVPRRCERGGAEVLWLTSPPAR